MTGQWIIWLLVTGFAYVSGNNCDTAPAVKHFSDLVRYEGSDFPLYGQGVEGLENTCGNINSSFEYIDTYIQQCNGTQECNKTCQDLIKPMQSFLDHTGLKNLEEELCEESSDIRKLYLLSYECLEKNSDAYSACHNKSEMSKKYLYDLDNKTASCCYFSWYHDCFINITKEHCDKDATEYVKSGLSKLVGHMAEKLCMTTDITCSSPPLPSDEVGHKEPDKVGHKEPEREKKNEDAPVQKVNDINGSKKDKHENNSASIISCPIARTVVAFYLILFMNLLIH